MAIGLSLQILDSYKIFDFYPMTDQTFAASGSMTVYPMPPAAGHVNDSGVGGSNGSINVSCAGPQNLPSWGPTVGKALSNMHGEFFVPSELYAIQYLRNLLTIRGFKIMNIDTLKAASIPNFNQIEQ
ncbi:hypothetical protein PTTG_08159 [Puccinia triticina 1-1 BBBD Race 1]|uniref:Uncharacterized protein n=1 Tax=Puccinia triticina (isolate 1-1 / race 1 (BBBD)) TaxID=630390 RepID=A0A180G443_PUCT1|nr:hypothetical protein PTTG_08159 [Puccinia triticina 1-1 BBBD Race 1]